MPNYRSYYTYRTPRPKKHKKARIVFALALLLVGFLVWRAEINHPRSVANAKTGSSSVSNTAQTSSGNVAAASDTSSISTQLKNDWTSTIAGRQGDVDIAVYDSANGQTTHYSNVSETFDTASIVKLSILEAVLVNDQSEGRSITSSELAVATPMIENSDNDAATALWTDVGGTDAMNTFFSQVGTTSTTAEDAWGLTQTTALDQLKILGAMAYPNTLLTSSSVSVITGLLDQVEADQTWGVSSGVPNGVTTELKNGWLPDADTNDKYSNTNDWTVNSIGHIHGNGVDYTIAVLTEGDPSEQYGINTIQSLSGVTWTDISS